MKNFTNNFKQFTSRLSARWLIMALMMLVGTSSAWGVTKLTSGQLIEIEFDGSNITTNQTGWNGTVLYLWYDDNTNETKDYNGVITLSSGDKVPSGIQFRTKNDYGGNRGKTADIHHCNTGGALKAGYRYIVKLDGSNSYKTSGDNTYNRLFSHTLTCKEINLCETTFVVAGSSGLANGEDWNQNSTKNVMICNQGIYTITFNNVAAGNYEYKVVKQKDWNVAYPGSNKSISFDSNSNVTITFNFLTKEVSHEVSAACVTINDLNITASKTTICDGESVTLTLNNKQDGVTYKIGNTTIFNSNVAKPTYNTGAITGVSSKSYTITAEATNQCESKSKKIDISINDLPSAPQFNAAPSYCAGDEITLPIKDNAKNTVTWYDEQGNAAGDPATTAGTYTYKAKATNTNGCVSSDYGTYSYKVKSLATASNYELTNTTADYTGRAVTLQISDVIVKNDAGAVSSIYFKKDAINVDTYKVYVTTEANNTYCAATDLEIGEFTINCKAPTEVDFVYSGATVTYDGNAQAQTVTWANNNDKGGAITVWYKSGSEYTQTAPTNAGVYTVAVTSAAEGNYCATEQKIVKKETLTIQCAEATKTQYPFEPVSFEYDGIAHTPTITPATGAGKITKTVYKKDNEIVENPTEVGEYTIYVTSEKGTGYCAVTDLEVGSFTITCDKPVNPILSKTNVERCNGNVATYGTITITNFEQYESNYKFYLGRSEVTPTNEGVLGGIDFPGRDSEIYTVKVTNTCGATTLESDPVQITLTAEDITPVVGTLTLPEDFESCDGKGISLALTDWNPETGFTYHYIWEKSADGNTYSTFTGTNSANVTTQLSGTTWYRVKVTKTGNGCTSPEATSNAVKVTALPLSTPEVTASAYSGVNAIDLTINVQDAGCAPNYTLGYRIKQSDDLEYSENKVVKTNTTETQVSTTIDGLVTGVEYIIQAYIINGYNNNEVFYADPITCTVLASENCDAPSADYIEILANNDDALQLYAWTTVNGTTPLGGFPGKTRDTWYEVNSTGYSVWKIETSDPVYLIFNKGDNSKTGDIKGTDNEGFKPGYRYIFDVNLSTWNYTLQNQTLIADPEVETVSATPVRIDETKSNVTLVGRIIKRGCADIRSYGFQYKLIDAKDYTNLEVGTGDIEPGSTFTGSLELGVGTYYLRARVENENGSKAYGDVIRVTIANRDLTIAAIDDDISVDTDTYYDFVGLYMSSITKPTTVDIESYTWYKDGSVYNPSIAESDKYGGKTYINTNGSNNIRPNETGVYKLEVELSNGTTLESNEITVTEASAVSASSILTASNRTLPVISVRTNEDFPKCSSGSYPSAQADKLKKKRSVDVKIFDKDGKLYYDRKARMNYRGSSSLNFVKKSYAFCPGGDMCGDVEKGLDYVITEKVNMFNLGASDKDWVLYAAAADPSLMRNRIVFDTYAAMTNKWGVKSMFVELVVDGEYKGVYVFMDKITKNKNRVNITAADGFIVKFDKTDTADRYVDGKQEKGDEKTFMTERTGIQGISTYGTTVDQMFEIEYPEKDDNKGTWNNIVASIKDKFETFETALEEGNYSKVREIIDYDSWADWFIISEYIKNQDAYRASCIFVYNGEKIEARPLWDQELSMNNTSHTSHNCDDTNSLLITTASIYGDDFPAPFWFTGHDGASIKGGLLKDGCFISLVQTKLADYLKEGAALYAGEDAKDKRGPILKLAHDFNEELVSKTEGQTSAQEREDKFWDGKSRYSAECGGTHSYSQSSYSNEYGNVKNWILGDRDENLTSILGGMSGEMTSGISITTSPDNAIVTPWIPITVTVNVADDAEYIYDDSSITQGIELDVDKAITSKSGNKYTYTFPRPTDWGNNNVDTPIQQIVYPITAKLKVYDTVCPGVNNETGVYIKLQDEGNDICGELVDQ